MEALIKMWFACVVDEVYKTGRTSEIRQIICYKSSAILIQMPPKYLELMDIQYQ